MKTLLTLTIALLCYSAVAQTNSPFITRTNHASLDDLFITHTTSFFLCDSSGEFANIEWTNGYIYNPWPGSSIVTNVYFFTNYTGTIQVGTNFFRASDLAAGKPYRVEPFSQVYPEWQYQHGRRQAMVLGYLLGRDGMEPEKVVRVLDLSTHWEDDGVTNYIH